MNFERSSGVLCHISSLPSGFGIGDLGPNAYSFVKWLVEANQRNWQVLPFSIADDSGNPYSSYSAYGGFSLLISPEKLVEDGLLKESDYKDSEKLFGERVEFHKVREFKTILFQKAFENFSKKPKLKKEFKEFCQEEKEWLDDLSLFLVLTEQFGTRWTKWPTEYRNRYSTDLKKFVKKNSEQIDYYKFVQYIFFKQWHQLKSYANESGIKIIGDIPIFLSHHSMDVWRDQSIFKLSDGEPYVVTGAPPDAFNPLGQKWGNPNYDWLAMEQNGFDWWIKRMSFNLKHFDIIRLDHFRGFSGTWEIPADNPDPRSGYWSEVPGHNLFHCFGYQLGDLPLIVEDLGKITDDVTWLRDRFGFPGMKVLQFAFGEGDENINLPHNYDTNHCVVYTGTHDNETAKGWFNNSDGVTLEKQYAEKYLGAWNRDDIHWSMINLAMHSRADLAVFPLQDTMGLGNEGRLNIPGLADGNWAWRFEWDQLHESDQEHLSNLTKQSNRKRD